MIDLSIPFAPSCTVVVCTRNRPESLHRCLAALARLDYPHFDVLVVDNAPGDSRAEIVARRWQVRYLEERIPGLSRARNAGVRACTSDIVVFTDDDAIPEPDWVSRLVDEFRDRGVGVVTGRIRSLGESAYLPDVGTNRITLDRSDPRWFESASFGGIGNGGNMAFRRRALSGWGGFDERLGRGAPLSGCEEYRAFAELIERGSAIVYTPRAVVGHPLPGASALRREQFLRSRSDLAGYAVFLFVATRYRWRAARYVMKEAMARRRLWRSLRTDLGVRRRETLVACVTGVWRAAGVLRRPRESATPRHSVLSDQRT